MCKNLTIILLLALCVSSCSATKPVIGKKDETLIFPSSHLSKPSAPKEQLPDFRSTQSKTEHDEQPQPYVEIPPLARETRDLNPSDHAARSFGEKKEIQVSFDRISLGEFVHHVFGDVLEVNYLVNDQVANNTKPITLKVEEPVSKQRLYELVLNLLSRESIDVIGKDDFYYIGPKGTGATHVSLGIGNLPDDVPKNTGDILQLVPIRYANLTDLKLLMKQVMRMEVEPYAKENVLAISGTREQIQNALDFVALLDRPAMRGRYVALIKIEYWNCQDIIAPLGDALMQEGIPVSKGAGQNGVFLMPLDRLNSLLVFSAEDIWLARAKTWVRLLDQPSPTQEKSYIVYVPEYATARDLFESLSLIVGLSEEDNGVQEGSPVKKEQGGTLNTYAGARVQNSGTGGSGPLARSMSAGRGTGGVLSGGSTKPASAVLTPQVRFAVDETRNVLIFYATTQKYQELKALLRQLDQIPVQVVIDANVIEVTLVDSLSFGVEWFVKNGSGSGDLIMDSIGTAGGLGSGTFNFLGTFNDGDIRVALSALAEKNLIKVLSSPKITVRDGKTATIMVGTEVPIVTAEATSSDLGDSNDEPSILRSIQYRNTGVNLAVTPTVNANGVVSLVISQEVSEASNNTTSDIDSPLILNRSINTEVVAGDGQTVFLGGLIKENKSTNQSKVPGLGNVPLLGSLFKKNSQGLDRTELVVLLTPRILRSTKDMDDVRRGVFEGFDWIRTLP